MMQIQVCVTYLITLYLKTRGDLWHSGHALYYVFGLTMMNVRGVEQLMNYPVLYSALAYSTLLAEVAIPSLLWFRPTRIYAVLIGLCLHGWIMLFMQLPAFGIIIVASYISFFTEEEYAAASAWLRARYCGWTARRQGENAASIAK